MALEYVTVHDPETRLSRYEGTNASRVTAEHKFPRTAIRAGHLSSTGRSRRLSSRCLSFPPPRCFGDVLSATEAGSFTGKTTRMPRGRSEEAEPERVTRKLLGINRERTLGTALIECD